MAVTRHTVDVDVPVENGHFVLPFAIRRLCRVVKVSAADNAQCLGKEKADATRRVQVLP